MDLDEDICYPDFVPNTFMVIGVEVLLTFASRCSRDGYRNSLTLYLPLFGERNICSCLLSTALLYPVVVVVVRNEQHTRAMAVNKVEGSTDNKCSGS